jgi:hypothetical protein
VGARPWEGGEGRNPIQGVVSSGAPSAAAALPAGDSAASARPEGAHLRGGGKGMCAAAIAASCRSRSVCFFVCPHVIAPSMPVRRRCENATIHSCSEIVPVRSASTCLKKLSYCPGVQRCPENCSARMNWYRSCRGAVRQRAFVAHVTRRIVPVNTYHIVASKRMKWRAMSRDKRSTHERPRVFRVLRLEVCLGLQPRARVHTHHRRARDDGLLEAQRLRREHAHLARAPGLVRAVTAGAGALHHHHAREAVGQFSRATASLQPACQRMPAGRGGRSVLRCLLACWAFHRGLHSCWFDSACCCCATGPAAATYEDVCV